MKINRKAIFDFYLLCFTVCSVIHVSFLVVVATGNGSQCNYVISRVFPRGSHRYIAYSDTLLHAHPLWNAVHVDMILRGTSQGRSLFPVLWLLSPLKRLKGLMVKGRGSILILPNSSKRNKKCVVCLI